MNKYEHLLHLKGFQKIIGLDEVGRGCIAGPLVVCGIILPINYKNEYIKDSKLLTAKQRKKLSEIILKDCIDVSITIIDPLEVDKLNPKKSSIKGMENCIKKINTKPDFALIDFEKINTDIPNLSITKGDQKSISIAAASIIAKVYRDKIMDELDIKYPKYFFKNNKGYLTKQHLEAIKNFGPIKDVHRFSYKPIKQ